LGCIAEHLSLKQTGSGINSLLGNETKCEQGVALNTCPAASSIAPSLFRVENGLAVG
jgi:hypothetical protein